MMLPLPLILAAVLGGAVLVIIVLIFQQLGRGEENLGKDTLKLDSLKNRLASRDRLQSTLQTEAQQGRSDHFIPAESACSCSGAAPERINAAGTVHTAYRAAQTKTLKTVLRLKLLKSLPGQFNPFPGSGNE